MKLKKLNFYKKKAIADARKYLFVFVFISFFECKMFLQKNKVKDMKLKLKTGLVQSLDHLKDLIFSVFSTFIYHLFSLFVLFALLR
jgi:hypothetical protein